MCLLILSNCVQIRNVNDSCLLCDKTVGDASIVSVLCV